MIYFFLGAVALGLLYLLWENTHFTLTKYEYHNPCVPEEMDGLRIMQVSDLHNQSFGKGNKRLLSAIRDSKPDVIMITGDLIDSSFTDLAVGIEFVKQAAQITPVYYCTGNHEHRLPAKELRSFLSALEDAGAVLLLDRAIPFYGSTLVGLRDPSAKKHSLRRILQQKDSEGFTLLLTHKPHYFENYKEADLILCGHAHGGQIRLPWIGGILAPGQGFFPEYTRGFYTEGSSTMLVSRGIGNSHRVPRLFNSPELILLTLRRS